MMKLKSNQPAFQVVVGPFAGRAYKHGTDYRKEDIPPNEQSRFTAVKKAVKPPLKKSGKAAHEKETL